jgi:hypothetical protein
MVEPLVQLTVRIHSGRTAEAWVREELRYYYLQHFYEGPHR